MKGKIKNWIYWKWSCMQTEMCKKHDGMGTVEVILIIVYILTIQKGCNYCKYCER